MSDTNQITVRGRVGTDPDILVTANGKEMTRFRLGSTRSFRDTTTGDWRDTETEWFTVKTWGASAQMVQESVRRGMPVIVQGVLSSEEWVSNERHHHTNVITAGTIGVDIKYGRVTFTKVTREAPAADDVAQSNDGAGDTAPDGEQRVGARAADAEAAADGEAERPDFDEQIESIRTADTGGDAVPVLAPVPVDSRAWEKVGAD